MSADLPPDAAAREAAVTDFAHNLCVAAGAGAGKTSLLVERLLHALLVVGLPMQRLAAITFTDKAAAEMRARLAQALQAAIAALEPGGTSSDAARRCAPAADVARRVLERAARLGTVDAATMLRRARIAEEAPARVATIHSFALALLHRHPIEAGVPAGVAMDLGDGWRRHVRAQLPAAIAAALAAETKATALRGALAELEVDQLGALVTALAWLPGAGAPVPARTIVAPLLLPLLPALATGRAALPPPTHTTRKLYEQWDLVLDALHALDRLPVDAAPASVVTPALRTALAKEISKAKVVSAAVDVDACRALLAKAYAGFDRLLQVDDAGIELVLAAALPIAKALKDDFLRGGRISADGTLALAAQLLAQRPAVRRAEAATIDLLCVDEFQDTDALQCELVLRLCELEPAAGAPAGARGALATGRLFLVGDPKQSIYRFRGADLDIYRQTIDRVLREGGRALSLSNCFRSPRALVDPVNHFFAAWSDPTNDAEPTFEPLHAGRGDEPGQVELWQVVRPDPRNDATARAEAEGRAIAADLAARRGDLRRLQDVAILLRDLSDLHWFAGPLRDHGIPYAISGGRTFARRSEVGELASLLLAAADPEDEVAALGALRSGLGGLTDAELLATKRWRGTLCWPKLLDHPVPAAQRVARVLATLHEELATRPLRAAVTRFVDGSWLLPLAALARDGEQRLANLHKLAERVIERAEEHRLPLAEAVREVIGADDEIEGESERSLADDELDAVRLLTIHKAKGLEFEHVYVPDLGHQLRSGQARPWSASLVTTPHGTQHAVSLRPLRRCNSAQLLREARDEAHRQAENKRLLYVAMTRARTRLVLVAGPGPAAAPANTWLAPLLRSLPANVAPRSVPMPPRPAPTQHAQLLPVEQIARARHAFDSARAAAQAVLPTFVSPSHHEPQLESSAATPRDETLAADPEALSLGTLLHAALAQSGPRRAPTAAELAFAAAALPMPPIVRARIVAAASALLSAPPARQLFAELAAVETVAVELPLLLRRGDQRFRGAADLVFMESGALVVADWKSDRSDDFEALASRYRPQLEVYREALAAALQRPVPRVELLLLRHGRRLPL